MSPLKLIRFLLFDFFTFYGGGKGGGSQTVTQRTEIPEFLRPSVKQQAQVGSRALQRLESLTTGDDLVTLNLPEGARVVNGRVVMDAPAQSGFRLGVSGLGFGFDPSRGRIGLGAPGQTIDLGPVSQFQTRTPGQAPELVAPLQPDQLAATNLARERAAGAGGFIPIAQEGLLRTARGAPLDDFVDQTALQALRGTSAGDFLFGGQGFNEAVDATLRRVQPAILSRFGGSGRGTGGLAQTAIAQAASDAFAQQFGQERQRQLGAAGALGELSQAERSRQMQAFGALPGIGVADVGILHDIGGLLQAQRQRQIDAPRQAQMDLITASGGGVPLASVLGQQTTQPLNRNIGAGALGGGLSGLGLAGMMFPAAEGATGLAALSGLGPLGLLGFGAGGALLGGLLS